MLPQDVPNCVLQLLAVACMLLAAKGLEVVHPTVQQLSAVTANHFLVCVCVCAQRVGC